MGGYNLPAEARVPVTELGGSPNKIVYINSAGQVTELPFGQPGQVLSILAGGVLGFDIGGGGTSGNIQNVNAAGFGLYKQTQDGIAQFRGVGVASNRMTVTLNNVDNTILFDVDTSRLPVFQIGAQGVVPGPAQSDAAKFLRGDSTWATPAGEANTASNLGATGVGLFKGKVGVDLQLKRLVAGSAGFTITDDTVNDRVVLDVNAAQLGLTNSWQTVVLEIGSIAAALHQHKVVLTQAEADQVLGGAPVTKATGNPTSGTVHQHQVTWTLVDGVVRVTAVSTASGHTHDPAVADGRGRAGQSTLAYQQASHGFTAGTVVRRSGGVWVAARANSDAASEAVAIVAGVEGDWFTVALPGQRVSGLTGLVDGAVYFLSPSTAGAWWLDGSYTPVAGEVLKPVFIAISTTEAVVINVPGIIQGPLIVSPSFEVRSTSGQSLPGGGAVTQLSFTDVLFNIGTALALPGTLTIPADQAGVYHHEVAIELTAPAAEDLVLELWVGGAFARVLGSGKQYLVGSALLSSDAGDVVTLRVRNPDTNAVTLATDAKRVRWEAVKVP